RGLERHVVVAGGRVVREGLRGRGDGCRRRRAAPAHELHAFGHDFDDGALAPVLGFPLARLQTTFDKDGTALVEVLAAALRLLAPYDDGEEAGLFALLAALRGVVAIHGQSYIRNGGPAWRVAKLRGLGQVADQKHLVQARHQLTSSTTSSVLAGRAFLRIRTRVLT